jgi:GH35 family endo-1,4-beta-xylanase
MKRIKNLLLSISFILIIIEVSCTDEFESRFTYSKPEKVAISEYINSYDTLKSYVNREANANFKLGALVSANDFSNKQLLYSLVRPNFDEVTSDYGMTHGSIVKDDGSMDFSAVDKFIQTAKDGKITVYGHTLCWHAHQNVTYLNEIIKGHTYSGTTLITDFESDELGKTYPMTGNSTATVVVDPAGQSGKVLHVGSSTTPANQSFPKISVKLPEGRKLGDYKTLTFDFYGTGSSGLYGSGVRLGINDRALVVFGSPSSFGCPDGGWGRGKIILQLKNLNLTDTEKELTSFTLILGSGTGSGNYYIDNIIMAWEYNDIKTPEMMKVILSNALEAYIAGIMKSCAKEVASWDVVSEPMSDNDNYMLKSSTTEPINSANFYWQDYLGEDYARKVISLARKYFKENGGNENNLKLFIDEYGLENYGNSKCNRLLQMIDQWEDDTTKIDGIATQMHVTYSLNLSQQEKNEEGIVNMFQLLANTGKLIKISALDMNIRDENGLAISASNLSLSQQLAMAEYYNFIVRKYYEIVPVGQRYGITIGSLIDTSDDQPLGLWDKNYNRKLVYTGFADGLAGKEYIGINTTDETAGK